MRYNGVTFMAHQAHVEQLAGCRLAGAVGVEGTARLERPTTPTAAQTSPAGTFGRDAAGPNDWVNTDGRLIGDRPIVAKAQLSTSSHGASWAPSTCSTRPGGSGPGGSLGRPGFPGGAQINMEANTGERRVAGRQPHRPARAEGVPPRASHADRPVPRCPEPDQQRSTENVASQLGTATAFGVADPLHPAAAHPARHQVPVVEERTNESFTNRHRDRC